MVTGQPAFSGSQAATIGAILHVDPRPMGELRAEVPHVLEAAVGRALAKDRAERWQSAHDFGLHLVAIGELVGTAPAPPPTRAGQTWRRTAAVAALACAIAVLAALLLLRTPASRPVFQRVTFRRGLILTARFTPDPRTIVYGAAWDGRPTEAYVSRIDSPESRRFGAPAADVLAVSSRGDVALSLGRRAVGLVRGGTLARVAFAGGAPREMLADALEADWAPNAVDMLVVRRAGTRCWIEFPAGHVVYETTGLVTHARVSPWGDAVAFVDHGSSVDTAGASRWSIAPERRPR